MYVMGTYCVICTEATPIRRIGQCGHSFCHNCIYEWLEKHNTCPMCRRIVQSCAKKKTRGNRGFFSNDRGLHGLSVLMGL